jgi:hypothetical protein
MAEPQAGDVLIRGSAGTGFEVLDAVSREHLTAFATFEQAIAFTGKRKGAVWQQATDNRGRPMGEPIVILPRISE